MWIDLWNPTVRLVVITYRVQGFLFAIVDFKRGSNMDGCLVRSDVHESELGLAVTTVPLAPKVAKCKLGLRDTPVGALQTVFSLE